MNREAGVPARMSAGRALSPGASWPRRCEALFEDLRRPARVMVTRAYGRALSDDQIEDVYSAAWTASLAALRDRGAGMADNELRAYVLTAVASHAGKEMRRRSRKPSASLADAAEQVLSDRHLPLPDEVAAGLESRDVARDVLASLPRRRRAVMLLRYGWGLSPDEICELVAGLSPRAYRKEITRGVEQLIERLGQVERGEWCASREPLIRDLVAGVADEDAERQARQHLRHCRGCAALAKRLGGELHELGGTFALTAMAGSLGSIGAWGHVSELFESARAGVVSLVDQVRVLMASLSERGESIVGAVAGSGAGRGAGAASGGVVAKLAGIGGAGKVAIACAGAGAAATACVAAGVVPGVALPGAKDDDAQRPRVQRATGTPDSSAGIAAASGHRIVVADPRSPDRQQGKKGAEPSGPDADKPPSRTPSESEDDVTRHLPASVREFDPVAPVAPAEAAPPPSTAPAEGSSSSPGGGSGGGSSSAAARSEFGP